MCKMSFLSAKIFAKSQKTKLTTMISRAKILSSCISLGSSTGFTLIPLETNPYKRYYEFKSSRVKATKIVTVIQISKFFIFWKL